MAAKPPSAEWCSKATAAAYTASPPFSTLSRRQFANALSAYESGRVIAHTVDGEKHGARYSAPLLGTIYTQLNERDLADEGGKRSYTRGRALLRRLVAPEDAEGPAGDFGRAD